MKLFVTLLALLALLAGDSCALDADNYTAYIEQLSLDEEFVEEYAKWSFELFSQPDYLYGDRHKKFPCALSNSSTVPTSVHALRPSDVRCVGAMGDSLTAGLGAHAHTPIGLLFENRGVSWSVGGDHTYNKILSIPNALRQYTPKLDGYSTKVSVMFLNGQNAKHNRLNVAKSGDRSNNMPSQADLLISRLKEDDVCNWDNDWKVITLFVGGNDLCSFCEDPNVTKHTPEFYLSYVRDALDKLYNAPLRRTLINLVLTLDVRGVKDLNSGGFVCQVLHKRTCPCAAFPTPEQAKILENYVPRYHQVLIDLVDSGRYDGRDDFTVVVQPFLAKTKIPLKENHKIDFSYFAPDCFHFSGKGHSQAALSLWNNMLEPVGAKQWAWHMGEQLKCPTEQYPYIFTKKNSAKALEEYQHSTAAATSTTARAASTEGASTATHHRRHKHRKSDSDSLLSKSQFIVFVGCFFLLVVLLILAMTKRQQIRIFMREKGRQHFSGFQNPGYPDDADDVEIWTRPGGKSGLSSSDAIPKTHGTRISFE